MQNSSKLYVTHFFEHSFNAYGHVTLTELYELKQKVENMQFSPQEPIDTLVTEINDLADIVKIVGLPITDHQCVDIRYIVLKNCGFFHSGDCGEYVVLILSVVYCTFRRSTSHSISSVVRGLRYIADECDMTFWKLSVACAAA